MHVSEETAQTVCAMHDTHQTANPQPQIKRPWAEALAVALLFVVLGMAATWPMATDPAHLSVVKPTDNDYRFNIFVIFWGAHALTTDPVHLHHTNMFYPERYTFAYSDILLSHSALMLPVILLTTNQVLTYNLLLLLSMSIGGMGFYLLCRELTNNRVAALAGAVIFVFNPIHFSRHVQIQMFGDHWIPWFAWALLIWLRKVGTSGGSGADDAPSSSWKWPATIVVFFCLNALSGAQPALFGTLIGGTMVLYYTVTDRLWESQSFRRGVLVMGIACLVLLTPIFWPYAFIEKEMLGPRTIMDQLLRTSAAPADLFAAGSRLYRWIDTSFGWPAEILGRPARSYLFPGIVPVLLAIFGLVSSGIRRGGAGGIGTDGGAARDGRALCTRDQLFWLVLLIFAFWLALGPRAGLYLIIERLPVLRLLRVPSRLFLIVSFSLSVLAAFGVARLCASEKLTIKSIRVPLLAGLALLFAVEAAYAPMTTHEFVPGPGPRHQFLANQPGDFAVVEFPIDPHNYTLSTRQVFNSVHHWKKLLVGYSGFQTKENVELLERLQATFPSDECFDELRELGVRYVIVLEARYGRRRARSIREHPRLQEVRRFGETGIYEILPREPTS